MFGAGGSRRPLKALLEVTQCPSLWLGASPKADSYSRVGGTDSPSWEKPQKVCGHLYAPRKSRL